MRSSFESDDSESRQRQSSSDGAPLLPTDPLAEDPTPVVPFVEGQHLTPRAVAVGLIIGTLACFSNSYFGLQTGWISMMSLPLSLLGFAVFKAFNDQLSYPFSPVENVLVQTVAVAVGTMPLAAGLVGIIPALEKLLLPREGGPLDLNWGMLVIWSLGVAFFGVFFAVPLRRQVIVREKYPFSVSFGHTHPLDFASLVDMLQLRLFQYYMTKRIPKYLQNWPGKRRLNHYYTHSCFPPYMYDSSLEHP